MPATALVTPNSRTPRAAAMPAIRRALAAILSMSVVSVAAVMPALLDRRPAAHDTAGSQFDASRSWSGHQASGEVCVGIEARYRIPMGPSDGPKNWRQPWALGPVRHRKRNVGRVAEPRLCIKALNHYGVAIVVSLKGPEQPRRRV